ncbi:MAG: hypothetical protein AVDCRST_MAG31-1461, partial [uncultured Sphingomonas sp.]
DSDLDLAGSSAGVGGGGARPARICAAGRGGGEGARHRRADLPADRDQEERHGFRLPVGNERRHRRAGAERQYAWHHRRRPGDGRRADLGRVHRRVAEFGGGQHQAAQPADHPDPRRRDRDHAARQLDAAGSKQAHPGAHEQLHLPRRRHAARRSGPSRRLLHRHLRHHRAISV